MNLKRILFSFLLTSTLAFSSGKRSDADDAKWGQAVAVFGKHPVNSAYFSSLSSLVQVALEFCTDAVDVKAEIVIDPKKNHSPENNFTNFGQPQFHQEITKRLKEVVFSEILTPQEQVDFMAFKTFQESIGDGKAQFEMLTQDLGDDQLNAGKKAVIKFNKEFSNFLFKKRNISIQWNYRTARQFLSDKPDRGVISLNWIVTERSERKLCKLLNPNSTCSEITNSLYYQLVLEIQRRIVGNLPDGRDLKNLSEGQEQSPFNV